MKVQSKFILLSTAVILSMTSSAFAKSVDGEREVNRISRDLDRKIRKLNKTNSQLDLDLAETDNARKLGKETKTAEQVRLLCRDLKAAVEQSGLFDYADPRCGSVQPVNPHAEQIMHKDKEVVEHKETNETEETVQEDTSRKVVIDGVTYDLDKDFVAIDDETAARINEENEALERGTGGQGKGGKGGQGSGEQGNIPNTNNPPVKPVKPVKPPVFRKRPPAKPVNPPVFRKKLGKFQGIVSDGKGGIKAVYGSGKKTPKKKSAPKCGNIPNANCQPHGNIPNANKQPGKKSGHAGQGTKNNSVDETLNNSANDSVKVETPKVETPKVETPAAAVQSTIRMGFTGKVKKPAHYEETATGLKRFGKSKMKVNAPEQDMPTDVALDVLKLFKTEKNVKIQISDASRKKLEQEAARQADSSKTSSTANSAN